MEETFKTIPSFPDYLISNFGRVVTKARKLRYTHAITNREHFRMSEERFLKVHFNNRTGYKFYQLYKDKKMRNRPIHSLVADAFLIRPDHCDCVNHKDGNKHNNIVDNLEWVTNKYNHEHAARTGLSAKGEKIGSAVLNEFSVLAIKRILKEGKFTHKEIAKWFNVSRSTVSLIHENKNWKHLTGKELKLTL
jgi:hypothetical protein